MISKNIKTNKNRDKDGFILDDKNKRILPSQDLTGKKYGRLTVIGYSHTDNNGRHWLCQCSCDRQNIITPTASALNSGNTKSCGCLQSEAVKRASKSRIIHKTRESKVLASRLHGMKQRCYNPNNKDYHNYGGRGIKICSEWLDENDGFSNFHKWALENGFEEHLSLDRVDNNKDYEPSNCRWTTHSEQGNNTRYNVLIESEGSVHTVAEWAEIKGLERKTLEYRVRKGWSADKLFQPSKTNIPIHLWGKSKEEKEAYYGK